MLRCQPLSRELREALDADTPLRRTGRVHLQARGIQKPVTKLDEQDNVFRGRCDGQYLPASAGRSRSSCNVGSIGAVLLVMAIVVAVIGCSKVSRMTESSVDVGPTDTAQVNLGSRAEVVARADQLTASAERATPGKKADLFAAAAELRERIWRIEGRKADVLEAVELYAEAGKDGDCRSRLRGSALSAEVSVEPGLVNRKLSDAAETPLDATCVLMAKSLQRVVGGGGLSLGDVSALATDAKSSAAGARRDLVIPTLPDGRRSALPHVENVERYGAKDSARIVVVLSEATTYRAGLLRADEAGVGARLYVDIDRAELPNPLSYPVGGVVQGVRLGKQADGVRLVLDLEEAVERRIFYMPEPFRLVVDVARGRGTSLLRAKGPRVIERVVIDPGHGGHDPGAIGPRGLREKDVTLDVAHRTAPLIARELGLSTLLTRDTDSFVALDERTAKANAFRADLFISIHCNAAEQNGSDGVVTFVLDASSDAAASRIAAIENAASADAAKELANSLGPTQDEGVLARSTHFAELLQRSTVASLAKDYGKIPNQGVRRAGFYVLAGAHMPAALYEVSFISNPEGEVRLNTADYRQRLADSIVNAVRAYRDGL